jgi:pimeloyl-ACP methyl ester carboxylesterase
VGVEEVELDGDGRGIPIVGDLARDAAAIDRAVALQRRALDLRGARGATRLVFFGHSAGGLQGASLAASEPDRLDFFPRELAW